MVKNTILKKKKQRVNLSIDPDMWLKFKKKCWWERISASAAVESFIYKSLLTYREDNKDESIKTD